VCAGAGISAGRSATVSLEPPDGRLREARCSRRESTRLVRDRRGGTVSQDALLAGQQPEGRVGGAAVVIAGRWVSRVPASSASPLVCASNTVRTCVQRIRSTSQCLQVGDLRRSAMTYPGLPGSPDRLSMSGCGASIREAWRTEPFHNPTPCRGWDQRSSCAVRSSLSRHHGATQPGGTARTAPARPTSLSSGEERKPCRP
jgi:hypothetical protein